MFKWLWEKRVRVISIPPANAAPPGFAHEHLRERFINLELQVVPRKERKMNPPSPVILEVMKKTKGYLVRRPDTIEKLREAGFVATADFWSRNGVGHYFFLPERVCEGVGWRGWIESFWRDGATRMFRPY